MHVMLTTAGYEYPSVQIRCRIGDRLQGSKSTATLIKDGYGRSSPTVHGYSSKVDIAELTNMFHTAVARARLGAVLSYVTDSHRRPKYCLRQNAAPAGSVLDRIPGSRSVQDRT